VTNIFKALSLGCSIMCREEPKGNCMSGCLTPATLAVVMRQFSQ